MNNKRKKRIVEIYFILYLAALVFLIPGKVSRNIESDIFPDKPRIFQLPFSLKSEKNALNATVRLDSNGISIISIDSTNTIFYTGEVKNIKINVTIEDRNTRQVLTVENFEGNSTDFFRYSTDEISQSLKFFWDPPLYDRKSKTYIVKVTGEAISSNSETLGLIVEDVVQFSLNLNYITDFNSNLLIATETAGGQELPVSGGQTEENRSLILPATNLFLSPRDEIVKSIAYTPWENEITIFGLNPKIDLRKQPEIKIIREPDNKIGGSAKIISFTESSLLIKGETPGYGVLKVSVSLTRHADGKEAIREFSVVPQLTDEPKYQQVVYPDIRYTFDPKLPILTGQKTSAYLKTADGKIYAAGESGSAFSFTPSMSDTGKTLYFERYIDNNLMGQRYTVRISMFPVPEIARISEIGKNTIRIFTNCYGNYQGRENYISKIDVLRGNAKIREIIGAQKNEEGSFNLKQVFEITPANSNSEFTFTIQAVANNGQKSEVTNYSGK